MCTVCCLMGLNSPFIFTKLFFNLWKLFNLPRVLIEFFKDNFFLNWILSNQHIIERSVYNIKLWNQQVTSEVITKKLINNFAIREPKIDNLIRHLSVENASMYRRHYVGSFSSKQFEIIIVNLNDIW